MQYLFPEFTEGEVFYKKNKGGGKLNYNILLGEVQFLENDQVMALANVKDVVMMKIEDRRFYPFNKSEFTEELMSTGNYKLRVRRKGEVNRHSKKGAYGIESSTSAITSYSSISSNSQLYNLKVQENVLVTLRNFYYLVLPKGKHTLINNAESFIKQFPAFRMPIEAFIKEHNTRFDNEDDLKALFIFCEPVFRLYSK
jgi:hypothetical protein